MIPKKKHKFVMILQKPKFHKHKRIGNFIKI